MSYETLTNEDPAVFYGRYASLGGTDNANDAQGHYNMTFSGTPSYTTPPPLPAMESSGRVFNVSSGNNLNGTGNYTVLQSLSAFTLSAWVNFGDVTDNEYVFGSRVNGTNQLIVYTSSAANADGTHYLVFSNNNGGASTFRRTANNTILDNTWYFITCVFDGSLAAADRAKIYINGVRADTTGTGTVPATTSATLGPLRLGNRGGAADGPLSGSIFDARVYLRAFTSVEPGELYLGPTVVASGRINKFQQLNIPGV